MSMVHRPRKSSFTCFLSMRQRLISTYWETLSRRSIWPSISKSCRANSLSTTLASTRETTLNACHIGTATDPAKQSDLHQGKHKVSNMLSKGDVPKGVSCTDPCSPSDLAKVQHTVCTSTSEAWATLYKFYLMYAKIDFAQWQVTTFTLTDIWLQSKKKLLSRLRLCFQECLEETCIKRTIKSADWCPAHFTSPRQ
ncbi:uncharacterized protein LOC129924621 isoform X2 [Biomphalaria glabrata]|uniref:Uncharacterized protein LOC129924621 isoform X2 n=1 Tax=Biomphalaria glabrata TaxID=6526 RepID=A0A9W2ZP43_BIOGL|nr:uncharacterized protein LOC129924621 isoform X2 [Biomphalaria glabrata]